MPEKDFIQSWLLPALLVMCIAGGFWLLRRYGHWSPFKWFRFTSRKQEFEIQLLKTQLELQEQALCNISQEIHDNIGQALTFVKLNINTIDISKADETTHKLSESKQQLSKVIQDLRNLSRTLNADCIIEAGLSASIQDQLFFLEETGVYTTSFCVSETWRKSPADTEVMLFRVVQELLNNIVKHAEATTIDVAMDYHGAMLYIGVKDNGKGFSEQTVPSGHGHKGIGLMNMKKRIALLKGNITIESMPENGTSVFISVPVEEPKSGVLPAVITSRAAYNSLPA